jgi:O-antigen/teichoic acid export membrane protein
MTGPDAGDDRPSIEVELMARQAETSDALDASPTSARVLNSALWSALASLISAPVLIVTTVVTARILGVTDFGRFAYYTYLAILLTGLADLGIGTALIRAGAHAAGRSDENELMRCVRAGTTWSMLQIPWALFVGWLVLPGFTAELVFGVAMVTNLAFLGPSHYLVMTSSLRWASQVRLMALALNSAGLLTAAAVTGDPAVTFAAGTLGTSVLTGVQAFALPRGRRLASLRPGRLRLSHADAAFGFGTLLHNQLNGFVFSRSEVLFFRSGQARSLGTFASAQTVAARSSLFIDVFFGAVPTALTSAYSKGPETLRRAFTRVSQAVGVLFTATAPLIVVAVATLAPLMFGHGFSGVAAPALVLAIASLFQSSMTPVLSVRFAQRSIRPMIIAGLAAAAVDAGLAALLIPHLAVTGAVIASVTSGMIYLAVATASYLRDPEWRAPVLDHVRRSALPLVAAAAVSVPVLWLSPTVGALIGIPVAAALSFGLLRLAALRLSDDGRAALLDASPAGLRRVVDAGLRFTSGRGKAAHDEA